MPSNTPLHTIPVLTSTRTYAVVDKPAGMLSVPGKGEANQDCVASRVRATFPHATGPIIVHRLDMDTSGLLVVALTPDSHRALSMQFESRQTSKRYEAVVDGLLTLDAGEVDLPIRPDIDNRPTQIVDHTHGRPSLTRWRTIAQTHTTTRVELEPVTGRTHQLRLHMASLGHAILGDVLYGEQPRVRQLSARLLLHARDLTFTDPSSGELVRASSPTPF